MFLGFVFNPCDFCMSFIASSFEDIVYLKLDWNRTKLELDLIWDRTGAELDIHLGFNWTKSGSELD